MLQIIANMETSGITTIQSIVDDYLVEIGSTSESDSLRFARIVERGMAHLSMFILDSTSVITMPVNKTLGTVDYPNDLRKLIRAGKKLGNGRIYTLTRDDELAFEDQGVCATKESESYPGTTHIGATAGRRGGYSELGTYKTDEKGRRLILGKGVNLDEVTFEYIGSGINRSGITYIPDVTREALVAFIKWKTSAKLAQGLRMEYKAEWNEALVDLVGVHMPTEEELMDAISQGSTQTFTKA